jgi:hypothetical protein
MSVNHSTITFCDNICECVCCYSRCRGNAVKETLAVFTTIDLSLALMTMRNFIICTHPQISLGKSSQGE